MTETKLKTTRDRILDAAQVAVLEKGFEGASIDEIAAAVEISNGGFFHHFSDKNALARALIERYIADEEALFDVCSSGRGSSTMIRCTRCWWG